jgi:rhodanese-related sulfurtransferase
MAKHSPGFLALVQDAKKHVSECTIKDVKARLDKGERFLLVDVREESEYAAGHLPSAVHMGRGILERDIEEKVPDKETEIVLYCGGGFRSALAAESLGKMGYKKVISMDGGVREWKDAGYPLDR